MQELESFSGEIQSKLTQKVEWVREKRPRVRITMAKGGYENEDKWPEIRAATVSALRDLIAATSGVLNKLTTRPAVGASVDEDEEQAEEEEE